MLRHIAHLSILFFFFNDTATTEIYTFPYTTLFRSYGRTRGSQSPSSPRTSPRSSPKDRKSTRLNSSHDQISYAVFCLTKKTKSYGLIQQADLLPKRHAFGRPMQQE